MPRLSKLSNWKKLNITKTLQYLLAFVIVVSGVWLLYYVVTTVSFFSPNVLPVPKKTLQLQTAPELFGNNPPIDVIFEDEDINYYTEQPRLLLDYVDFDLPNRQVYIPQIDKQNVHDSFIQKGIRKIYSEVNNSSQNLETVIPEILEYAGNDIEIRKVLETIRTRNANITNLNDKTEMELLSNVWGEAKGNDNIKQFLLTQLRDSYENGSVVCPTGTATRIVSSMTVENPDSFPKTKENINNEMMYTAAKLQKKLEKDKQYSDLSEIEQTDMFKSKLIDKYVEDYAGILTTDEITETIKPWIDHV